MNVSKYLKSKLFQQDYDSTTEGIQALVDEAVRARNYRDQYNERPKTKASQKAYRDKRNARIKRGLALLKD